MLPSTILKYARLSLFGRICVKSLVYLFSMVSALLSYHESWTNLVVSDLVWLTNCPAYAANVSASFDQWCLEIRDNYRRFKTQLSKYAKLRIANIPPDPISKIPDCSGLSTCIPLECSECGTCFNTLQKLSLHLFKKHGIRNLWRRYVHEHTHCPVCLRSFWTRERLINHIRYRSVVCKHNVIFRGFRCTEDEACEVDESVKLEHVQLQKAGK